MEGATVISKEQKTERLADFLEALGEWGTEDYKETALEILEFQEGGYDLTEYNDQA